MENPEPLAGLHVEPAHKSFGGRPGVRAAGSEVGRADDHDFAGDEGRRVESHRGRGQVVLLVVIHFQIDDTVFAERANEFPGPRIQRDHAVPGRDIDDPLVGAVGARPVRQATAGATAWSRKAARTFVLAVHPEHFARLRIQRNRGAPRAGGGVDHAVHIQRRRGIQVVRVRVPGNRS